MAKKIIKKEIKSNNKANKKPEIKDTSTKIETIKPPKKSFLKILRSLFFPSKEEYTPQNQLKELQFALYCLTVLNLILAIINPYILIDALILGLIAFNINKSRKKYVVTMLIVYTLSTIIINLSQKVPNLNIINFLLIVFSIQAARLVYFKKLETSD